MLEKYQEHINALANDLGCKVTQKPGMAGMMYVEYEPPLIEGPIIEQQKDYLVMLHELGHVAHGHTQGRPPYGNKKFYFENGVLHSEAQAWDYALALCIDPLNSDSRSFMWKVCLGSYYRGSVAAAGKPNQRLMNGNRHYISFTYDKPDDYFWQVKKRIEGDDA